MHTSGTTFHPWEEKLVQLDGLVGVPLHIEHLQGEGVLAGLFQVVGWVVQGGLLLSEAHGRIQDH